MRAVISLDIWSGLNPGKAPFIAVSRVEMSEIL
jgi:hypothetical protein